jgi:related to glycosyltransferase
MLYNQNIPDEEIYRYFEMAEFVVLPYKDATGSGVIPLAFAFSKAVIVSNV